MDVLNNEIFRNKKFLSFKDSSFFRFKISYSLLTMTPIEFTELHVDELNIGITAFELSFLKLVSQISTGSHFKISETGTSLKFIPGAITNNQGDHFKFETDGSRCLSYYLEGIFPICLFGKEKLNCTLLGVSNNNIDMSLDSFKAVIDSVIPKIVEGDTSKLEIVNRSFSPSTTSEVKVLFPIIRFIQPFDWTDPGKVKKIGGHCMTYNCTPLSNRIIDELRIVFNNFINEVWIAKNTYTEKNVKPGFGLSAWTISTNDTIICNDESSFGNGGYDPSELAKSVCHGLLDEVVMVRSY